MRSSRRSKRRYPSLTKKETAAIEPYFSARLAERHSTAPADRERVKRGIVAGYGFLNLPAPRRIIWVESPAVCSVAGPIAADLIQTHFLGQLDLALHPEDTVERLVGPYARGVRNPDDILDAVNAAVGTVADGSQASSDWWKFESAGDANTRWPLVCAVYKPVEEALRASVARSLWHRMKLALDSEPDTCISGALWQMVHEARNRVGKNACDEGASHYGFDRTLHRSWSYSFAGRAYPFYHLSNVFGFCRDVIGFDKLGIERDIADRIVALEDIHSAGWMWPHREFCMVSEPPSELHMTFQSSARYPYQRFDFHNPTGPAIVCRDGTRLWYVRGIQIDDGDAVIAGDRPGLTAARITGESNAERRRVLVELYGRERYLRDAGAARIDVEYAPAGGLWASPTDLRYRALWRLEQRDDEPIVLVDVINQSPEPLGFPADGEAYLFIGARTFKRYFLRVPPEMITCAEAIAWTCGKTAETYVPSVET